MAQKKKNSGDDSSGADIGVVMTCSLFLIILTFFILLNSIAVIDDRKQRLAIGSLVGSFGSLTGGLSPMKTGTSIMPSSAPIIEQSMDFKRFLEAINADLFGSIKVVTTRRQNIITINSDDLFDPSTHVIKPSQTALLDRIGKFIQKGIYPVEIIGHTDNRAPEAKGYRSNWEGTSLMAIRVLRYFVEQLQVDPKRLSAFGRGSQYPAASNDTVESRRLNRRIEIKLKYNMPYYARRIYGDRPSGNFTYKRFNFKIF
jgi:chemotaxis protein MotB